MRGNVRVGVSTSARLNVIVCRLFQLLEQNRPASSVIGAWVVVTAVVPVSVFVCAYGGRCVHELAVKAKTNASARGRGRIRGRGRARVGRRVRHHCQ